MFDHHNALGGRYRPMPASSHSGKALRTDDDGSGVQPHSKGALYPIIIVRYGDDTTGAQLGDAACRSAATGKEGEAVIADIARHAKRILDRIGYTSAQNYLRLFSARS